MACPECGGRVTFSGGPVAVEYSPESGGAWLYFLASCACCGWTGHGREWLRESGRFEDGVGLPTVGKDVLRR